MLLIPRRPALCSRHLYSHENYNVTGINSKKQQQLIPLQLPCSRSAGQQLKLQIKLRSSLPSQRLRQPPLEESWALGHDRRGDEPPGCWKPWGSESQTSSSPSMQGSTPDRSDLITAKSFHNISLAQQKLIDTIFHLHILLPQQVAMIVSSKEISCSPRAIRACTALLSPAGVPGSHGRLAGGEWITWSIKGFSGRLKMAPRAGLHGCRTHTEHFLILRHLNGLGKS